MFAKGQTVECIRPDRRNTLTKKALYTVYWSGTGFMGDGEPVPAVRVAEVAPPPPFNNFCASLFRPLKDSRLDVFRAMLVQTPAPVFSAMEDGA